LKDEVRSPPRRISKAPRKKGGKDPETEVATKSRNVPLFLAGDGVWERNEVIALWLGRRSVDCDVNEKTGEKGIERRPSGAAEEERITVEGSEGNNENRKF